MQTNLKNIVENVLRESKKSLHVDEIAQKLIDSLLIKDKDKETLANSISAALSADIKKKKNKSKFKKVSNGKNGFKRGFYQIRITKTIGKAKTIEGISKAKKIEMPAIPKSYTGTAGEHLVFSELLFQGFNASSMAVDEGIDIVCFKDEKFYYIQVKTANITDNGKKKKFLATIRASQFTKYERHKPYYIIVMRYFKDARVLYDFVVLPSMDIERYIEQGVIKNTTSDLSLSLEIDGQKVMLNGTKDISYYFNKFDLIK